jgi:RNA polymerase sigma factor (sigma-70 family)
MDKGSARSVLREIRTLYAVGTLNGLTDADLIERFLARGGDDAEDAFAALVHRHGPTVLGVCQRMLPASHDMEDVFQATFLVLARRAASIGRRERLANWLYGVAVRIAKDARRRSARMRTAERRLMDVSRLEAEPPDDRDDLLPLLDEELSRLPNRYRSALVAGELEGKSRRDAARELGIPEGTLSTHLARGRKLLRERLRRRGVNLGVGPIAGFSRPLVQHAIPERLIGQAVRAAMAISSGATAAVPLAVSTLAERVLKMMFLARLTLVVAAVMAAAAGALAVAILVLPATAAAPQSPVPREPGPDDLPGRVVDKTGKGVAGVEIWAMDGLWWTPNTVAKTTTDAQGRFMVPWAQSRRRQRGADNFSLLARGRDGSIGWQHPVWLNSADGKGAEIELYPVGDVRGRLTDQGARPIAGVEVAPLHITRSNAHGIRLSPETAALFRTTTGADGSFVLKGIPQGAGISATIAAPAFGAPTVHWDTSQAVTIALDGRLGRINGRLELPDPRGLAPGLPIWLHRSPRPDHSPPGHFELAYNGNTTADKDGRFQFDGLPPGRYVVGGQFERDGLAATNSEDEVEVGPGAVASLEIPLQRLPMISGRVVDARTGKGIAGVRLESLWRELGRNLIVGEATTDAEGRYRIPARPGKIVIQPDQVPPSYLGPWEADYPILETKADLTWPDIKFSAATTIHGIVVTESGQPVGGAEVYLLAPERTRVRYPEPLRAGPDGAFRFDQVDPEAKLALWARAGDATTNGSVVVRPRELKGKVSLAVDSRYTVRIRGLVTDGRGRRVSGAKVTLWWHQTYRGGQGDLNRIVLGPISALESTTTRENGWFLFRGLWPDLSYHVEIAARGQGEAEGPKVTGRAGETHDLGKIILGEIDGYLAGRVVGSDGRPIVGAAVFNRGDRPQPIATSTDPEGRFRLEGVFPGTRFAFARKDGYRFTGVKVPDDTEGLTITLLKSGEPPPAWRPGDGPSYDQQRAFARRILIRLWEQYKADAEKNGAYQCLEHMAEIDPDLAMQWSTEKDHAYDDQVRHAQARTLADTDATRALALLNQRADTASQGVLQTLAERFAESDPKKALRFADEAASQSRGLNQPDRTLAMARAGAVLVRLGRADVGRKLIDDAARDAAQLPAAKWAGVCRARTARILAPYDVDRAFAMIEPLKVAEPDWWQTSRAAIAAAIGRSDTGRAIALVDTVGDRGLDQERARTAIAYAIGADRPDEAIKIIEGIERRQWASSWQAGAFGWLAVALAPRDPARANALIDRALNLMIDDQDWIRSGDEMTVAARVAARAHRIGYPDMEGVIMRVMAARSGGLRQVAGDRAGFVEGLATAAIHLALIDPGAARIVLEQLEERPGLAPASLPRTRPSWLMAWALVDLEKAQTIFEAELAAFEREKRQGLGSEGFLETAELLIAPPDRREDVFYSRSGGGYWRPGEEP